MILWSIRWFLALLDKKLEMSKVPGKKGEKKGKSPGSQNSSRLPPALSIPKVFVTSEDDSTPPPIHSEDFRMNMMSQGQGYTKDEDAASMAPLLDSGATTPLCEEPSVPYANMGTFLASMIWSKCFNVSSNYQTFVFRFSKTEK